MKLTYWSCKLCFNKGPCRGGCVDAFHLRTCVQECSSHCRAVQFRDWSELFEAPESPCQDASENKVHGSGNQGKLMNRLTGFYQLTD